MCLLTSHLEPRIAKDDIEVYKVLTLSARSAYQLMQYKEGMNVPDTSPWPECATRVITSGYLHAFTSCTRAGVEAYKLTHSSLGCVYLATKMVIPKGTEYFQGQSGDICAAALYWPSDEVEKFKTDMRQYTNVLPRIERTFTVKTI